MKTKNAAIIAASILLAAPVVAQAEQHVQARLFGFPTGYTKINPNTCKFSTPEVDVRPNAMERYARAEDLRDDVLFQCIRKLAVKANKPDPCWTNPVPEVHLIRKDDWVGVRELRDYVAGVQACEATR